MENDGKMIELLADMLYELKGLRLGQEELRHGQDELRHGLQDLTMEVKEIKSDLLRNTNAFWEQSQLLQKVIWEPAQQQAQRLSDLEERVKRIEQAQ